MEYIKHILEERYYQNESFIEVTENEYNLFKEFIKSFYDEEVTLSNNLTYDGKRLKIR